MGYVISTHILLDVGVYVPRATPTAPAVAPSHYAHPVWIRQSSRHKPRHARHLVNDLGVALHSRGGSRGSVDEGDAVGLDPKVV